MSNGWRTHSGRKTLHRNMDPVTHSRSLLQVYLGGHHHQCLWSEQSQSFNYVPHMCRAEEKTQWEHCETVMSQLS